VAVVATLKQAKLVFCSQKVPLFSNFFSELRWPISAKERMTGKPFAPSFRWCWWRWRVSNTSQTVSRCNESSCPLTTIWSSINSTATKHCHHPASYTDHRLIQHQPYSHKTLSSSSLVHWPPSHPASTLQPQNTVIIQPRTLTTISSSINPTATKHCQHPA